MIAPEFRTKYVKAATILTIAKIVRVKQYSLLTRAA